MSAAGDPREAATRLFAGLRWLDAEGARLGLARIAVMPVPMDGLGAAINDRLGAGGGAALSAGHPGPVPMGRDRAPGPSHGRVARVATGGIRIRRISAAAGRSPPRAAARS